MDENVEEVIKSVLLPGLPFSRSVFLLLLLLTPSSFIPGGTERIGACERASE